MAKELASSIDNFPYKRLIDLLRHERKTCVIGYEFSWQSRIPHFDDILKGVWSKLTDQSKINPFTSVNDYCLVMNWFSCRRQVIKHSKPSESIKSLIQLQEILNFKVASQCVDGLLSLNGIKNVYGLYGNVFQAKCYENGHESSSWPTFEKVEQHIVCATCGSAVFPDVEMFGWNKKTSVRKALLDEHKNAEVLILIGADQHLTPFDEKDFGALSRIPMIELLEDGIVLREGQSVYKATINEMEKRSGEKLSSPSERSLNRTMKYLSQIYSI